LPIHQGFFFLPIRQYGNVVSSSPDEEGKKSGDRRKINAQRFLDVVSAHMTLCCVTCVAHMYMLVPQPGIL
jgi:hypothetical protein